MPRWRHSASLATSRLWNNHHLRPAAPRFLGFSAGSEFQVAISSASSWVPVALGAWHYWRQGAELCPDASPPHQGKGPGLYLLLPGDQEERKVGKKSGRAVGSQTKSLPAATEGRQEHGAPPAGSTPRSQRPHPSVNCALMGCAPLPEENRPEQGSRAPPSPLSFPPPPRASSRPTARGRRAQAGKPDPSRPPSRQPRPAGVAPPPPLVTSRPGCCCRGHFR